MQTTNAPMRVRSTVRAGVTLYFDPGDFEKNRALSLQLLQQGIVVQPVACRGVNACPGLTQLPTLTGYPSRDDKLMGYDAIQDALK